MNRAGIGTLALLLCFPGSAHAAEPWTLTLTPPAGYTAKDPILMPNGSVQFTFAPAGSTVVPMLTVNGTANPTVAPGANIAVAVAGGPGNPGDWLGQAPWGSPANTYLTCCWAYLNGSQTSRPPAGVTSATVALKVSTAPGQYEVRLYSNDTFTIVGTALFHVQ